MCPSPISPVRDFPQGIQCRHCFCRHFRVRNTVRIGRMVIRYRECRHCGRSLKTVETAMQGE